MSPSSVVLVRWPQGWVAHIRFDDPKLDKDISAPNKGQMYWLIDKYFKGAW